MSKRSIATVVVLAVLGLFGIAAAAFLVSGDDRRVGAFQATGSTGALALRLDNVWLPGLRSIDGCRLTADVVKTRVTNSTGGAAVNKHLGGVKFQQCVLRLQVGSNQVGLLRWIRDMLAGQPQRKDLTLVAPNPTSGRQGTSIEVEDALITSVRFPALNSASNAPYELELTVLPDQLTRTDYGATGPSMPSTQSLRPATINTFALSVQGLQDASFAIGAAAFTVEQKLVEQAVGEFRTYQQEPSELEIGNWAVNLPSNRLTQFNGWFQSFVLQGLNGDNHEKTGSLEVMGYNGTDVVFTLNFTGLGLFDADDITGTSSGRSYSLYVEGVTMTVGPTVVATTTGQTTTGQTTTAQTTTAQTTTAETTTAQTTTAQTTTAETTAKETLAPPGEIKASPAEGGAITLAWAPVEGAEYYVILSSTEREGRYAELARGKETEQTVGRFEPGTTVYLVVRSGRGEAQSADSEVITVEIP